MNPDSIKHAREARVQGTLKALLFDLATYANQKDGLAWPSQRRLAKNLCIDVRNVRHNLQKLIKAGLIVIEEKGGGRGRSTVYRLTGGAGIPLCDSRKKGARVRKGGRLELEKGVAGIRKRGASASTEYNERKNKNIEEGKPKQTQNKIPPEAKSNIKLWPSVLNRLEELIDDDEKLSTWFDINETRCLGFNVKGVWLTTASGFYQRNILNDFSEDVSKAAREVLGVNEMPEIFVSVEGES